MGQDPHPFTSHLYDMMLPKYGYQVLVFSRCCHQDFGVVFLDATFTIIRQIVINYEIILFTLNNVLNITKLKN